MNVGFEDRFLKFQKIVCKYNHKILKAFNDSWRNINFSQREELIIYDYITSENSGLNYLNKAIPPLFQKAGFIVKFAGVFVHQKPIVKRLDKSCAPTKRNCELGDLLTLFLYLDSSKNILFRKAFISQAKKKPESIDKRNCQICLYEQSTEFIYYRFRGLKGKRRILPEYNRRSFALNYLILLPNPHFAFLKPIPFTLPISRWSYILLATLLGIYGLNFGANTGYGWSKIIWDLIYVTGSSLFGKRGSRGYYLDAFLKCFNDFDNYDKIYELGRNEETEGMPMLIIIIQDKEIKI